MRQMTSTYIDIKDSDALKPVSTIHVPAKSSTNTEGNLIANSHGNDDTVSVMSDETDTTKERSYSSHDDADSDHDSLPYDVETAETTCTVKSILKEAEADWTSIRSEGPWKRLPEPMLPIGPHNEKPTNIRHERSVSFDSVQLRHYHQTLGDNPCVPYGPPIQLDWKYEEEELKIPIDEYECRDRKWKFQQQMVMSCHKRRTLLSFYYGFTEEELKQSEKLVQKIRRQRYWTQTLAPLYILEEALSSTCRRIKNFARKRSTGRSQGNSV